MWVNKKTRVEGFTAVHYAALAGNLGILGNLVTHGADINLDSNSGISPMHVAAQADQAALMVACDLKLGVFGEQRSVPDVH